jgi:3-deoxy-D-manno-octulosonate 8-phosphate phosphatase (KDO 8-P phosphatase)
VEVNATELASRVRALVLDVDGVLTDAGIYYDAEGEALKRFNVRDGQGIALVRAAGLHVALVTREDSEVVTRRAEKLRLTHVFQGANDKLVVVENFAARLDLALADICYVGDDLGDLGAMERTGLSVAVADAAPEVKEVAHMTTTRNGGEGAVREVCDFILHARGERLRSLWDCV